MPSRKFWPTTLSLSEDVMLALRHAAWRGVASRGGRVCVYCHCELKDKMGGS
jgi:hypothetical protein